jgi:hypothetical protein
MIGPGYTGRLGYSETSQLTNPMFGLNGLNGLKGTGTDVANIAIPVGSSIASSSTGAIASAIGLSVPVIGVAIMGVTFGITSLIGWINKRGQQKVAAIKIVEEVEKYMQMNVDAWNSSPKTKTNQQAALGNFNQLWEQMVKALSQGDLGSASERGISDRSRGGQWDWYSYYYDPIANDINVVEDSAALQQNIMGSVESVIDSVGGWGMVALGGVMVLVAIGMIGGGK